MHRRTIVLALGGALLAFPALAQDWGIGASYGLANDVERRFHLDEFHPRDVTAWVDYRLEEQVVLRGTFGSMKVNGDNAGRSFPIQPGMPPAPLPALRTRIDYAAVGVSYEFWEGDYTSGLFGGIGGYKVNPDPAPPELANFRDHHETVFGWHVGVDGDLRVLARLSLVGRITFHKIRSETGRTLLNAGAGLLYRF